MKNKQEMKKTTRLIGVIATAMVLSIAFSGVALAAQTTFSLAVQGGTVRTQSSQMTMTYGDLPFDEARYNRDIFAVHAEQFSMSSSLSTDCGEIEVQTSVNYIPPSGLKGIFLTEDFKKARVADGINESICYDASAKSRVTAHGLGYESAAIVDASNVAFTLNSVGIGKFSLQTQESTLTGDVNGTFTESLTTDSFKVCGGLWNASAEFTGEITAYPNLPERKDMLCPFFKANP